jgi:hypothetical protein
MYPLVLDGSAESRARARYRAEELRAKRELGRFIILTTPEYQSPEHLRPVLEVWDRIQVGEVVYALIEAPPRHGKTQTLFHGAARLLQYHPKKLVAYASYNAQIAQTQSIEARRVAARAGLWASAEQVVYRDPFDPMNTTRLWQTQEGGGFLAVGRGGGITGLGVDVLIVDDPFKDRAEAERGLIRENVWEWYRGTLRNRLEPGGSVLISHQRWNDDDLIARLVEQQSRRDEPRFERITLPAILPDGKALWPARYPLPALAEIRGDVGEYNWWSQFMQKPRPPGAALFHEPQRFKAPLDLKGARLAVSVDPAATEKTSRDASAIGVGAYWGWGDEMRLHIRRVWRLRLEVPELVDFLLALQFRLERLGQPLAPLIIEAVGGFKAVPQMLRRLNPYLRIVEVHPEAGKFVRTQPTAAAWNRGKILAADTDSVPDEEFSALYEEVRQHKEASWLDKERICRVLAKADRPWLDEYLDEHQRFTGIADTADDQVDMTTHLWDYGERAFEGLSGKRSKTGDRKMADTGGF